MTLLKVTEATQNQVFAAFVAQKAGTYNVRYSLKDPSVSDAFVIQTVTTKVDNTITSLSFEEFKENELSVGKNIYKKYHCKNKYGEEVEVNCSDITFTCDKTGYVVFTYGGSPEIGFTGKVEGTVKVTAKVQEASTTFDLTIVPESRLSLAKTESTQYEVYNNSSNIKAMPVTFYDQYGFTMSVGAASIKLTCSNSTDFSTPVRLDEYGRLAERVYVKFIGIYAYTAEPGKKETITISTNDTAAKKLGTVTIIGRD